MLHRLENKLINTLPPAARSLWRKKVSINPEVRKISFVCTGNICRSAYAEAKLKEKLLSNGTLEQEIEIVSSGLKTHNGKPANQRAIEMASRRGIDLSQHRTSQFDGNSADLFFCMEPWQRRSAAKQTEAEVYLIGDLAEELPVVTRDPYNLSEEIFDRIFDIIDRAIDNIALRVSQNQIKT